MSITQLTLSQATLLEHSSHGVITAERLQKLGIPQRTTYRRCQPPGTWTHLLPGIVLLSRNPPTARQRVEAALLHTDRFGLVTGFEATRRYGLSATPQGSTVHLLVPHQHRFLSTRFALVERTVHFPPATTLGGVPMAPPARAVLDGVRRIRELSTVSALLLEALNSGLCSHAELCAELDSSSQRGTALPRAILRKLAADIRSVPELESMDLWKRAGLPLAEHNVKIFDSAGKFIAMPDLWCDKVALAWEIDSWTFHQQGRYYAKTLTRNTRYAGQGIVVIQTLPSRLRTEPEAVIAELKAAYRAALARPRPPVTMVRSQHPAA